MSSAPSGQERIRVVEEVQRLVAEQRISLDEVRLRLTTEAPEVLMRGPFGTDFDTVVDKRRREADDFYHALTPPAVVISLAANRVLPLHPDPTVTRVCSAVANPRTRCVSARASSLVRIAMIG